MADVDTLAPTEQGATEADAEQPAVAAEEAEVDPPASPALAPLYGKHSFPSLSLASEVPVSAVIAACWPEKDAQARALDHACIAYRTSHATPSTGFTMPLTLCGV